MAKLTEQKILEWVASQPLPNQVKLFYTLKEQVCKEVESEKIKKENEANDLAEVVNRVKGGGVVKYEESEDIDNHRWTFQ